MSDEQRPTPYKRTATEAMRLRPAVRPGAAPEVAPPVPVDATIEERPPTDYGDGPVGGLTERLAARLETVLALHRPSEILAPPFCLECLLPHPCRTARAAEPTPGTGTPGEDASQ